MLENESKNQERIEASEKKIVEFNKKIDDQVIYYFKIALDEIRDRIKKLEVSFIYYCRGSRGYQN
jgi:hypothetical protein